MIIHFKNGKTKEVIDEISNAINENILKGCHNFQTFSDENGKLILIINLDDISYID